MRVFVPARLRETASEFGADGARWLDDLPQRVAELERAWSLTVGRGLDGDGQISWIAPARLTGGSEVILKVGIPHPEARCEADALRVWDGRGAVRLLRASEDGFALLIERCVPGTNLWSLGVDEGNAIGARVLHQLWQEPPPTAPFDRLADLAHQWCEALPRTAPGAPPRSGGPGYDPALVARTVELARELAATPPRMVLLHGAKNTRATSWRRPASRGRPSTVFRARRRPGLRPGAVARLPR